MFIEEGTSKVPIVRFIKAFSPRDLSEVLFIDDIGDKSGKNFDSSDLQVAFANCRMSFVTYRMSLSVSVSET